MYVLSITFNLKKTVIIQVRLLLMCLCSDVILPAPAAKMFVPPFIHVMDASYNLLAAIPKSFLEQVAPALRRLDLSHNRYLNPSCKFWFQII